MSIATTGPEQKTATQGQVLNEKPRYYWLNSDKMDGKNENGMVKKWWLEIINGREKRRMARQPKQLKQQRRDGNSHGASKQIYKNKSKQNKMMA